MSAAAATVAASISSSTAVAPNMRFNAISLSAVPCGPAPSLRGLSEYPTDGKLKGLRAIERLRFQRLGSADLQWTQRRYPQQRHADRITQIFALDLVVSDRGRVDKRAHPDGAVVL